jgi:hypothetical protein
MKKKNRTESKITKLESALRVTLMQLTNDYHATQQCIKKIINNMSIQTCAGMKPWRAEMKKGPVQIPVSSKWPMLILTEVCSFAIISLLVAELQPT